jgi:hypothetical protein
MIQMQKTRKCKKITQIINYLLRRNNDNRSGYYTNKVFLQNRKNSGNGNNVLPVVILVMSPYNTGQSCHLQHEVVAHSCYELPSKPWLRLHCYAAHESQRPYNIHHDTKRK